MRHAKIQSIKFFNWELHTGSFVLNTIDSFKPKHIEFLIKKWQNDGLSIGRIKNLMSDLRFAYKLIKKHAIVLSNKEYGIGNRPSFVLKTEQYTILRIWTRLDQRI